MTLTRPLTQARTLALLVPAIALAGALGSQYIGHLYPCEMCHWQRWPHYAALALALAAFATGQSKATRSLVILAALAIFISGAIGVFHAGVEYRWWEGFTTCTGLPNGAAGGDIMAQILAAPIVRCDQAQWTLGDISLAGFNALLSIPAAIAIWVLCLKQR
ncbi:disulfide bond formation protein B [Sphingomonas prati]|uniref:Disulfide bond formation protein DsbB n=1 Tax=Sphingomonas prati TaxID=1843237 RepID=A0A7W9BTQ8_9SPHN|nr:disulfide bond formation protein B [Sphingomonas prati]MBB5729957.1 disulfide bond formation protein DsbB [Sphingomonas prati]GGE88211.1 dihydroneopterin aldolase [Sphingomonas prati]